MKLSATEKRGKPGLTTSSLQTGQINLRDAWPVLFPGRGIHGADAARNKTRERVLFDEIGTRSARKDGTVAGNPH